MIVVDIETTGLDPRKHSIASIGALDFGNPENQFYEECRIWEGADVAADALRVNGFTEAQVKDPKKQSLEAMMQKFVAWTKSVGYLTFAGGNVFFDRDFLHATAQRYTLDWIFSYRIIDLHSLAYAHHLSRGILPPSKDSRTDLSVDKILVYTGLPAEPKPHIGIVGAKMEAEAFSRLIYGKSLLKEYAHFPVPDYLIRK